MKKLNFLLSFTIMVSMLMYSMAIPALANSDLSDAELDDDEINKPLSGDTLSFILKARWGYVRGNPTSEDVDDENEEESDDDDDVNTNIVSVDAAVTKNYDGSIYASDSSRAYINIVKKDHFEGNDTVTSKANPVSWESRINGHWDGVYVQIRAKEDANIVVNTTKGSITKTAKEWFLMTGHATVDFGANELLDVQTHRNNRRKHSAIIMWGKKDSSPLCPEPEEDEAACLAVTPIVDFSGSVTMDNGTLIKLQRELRFEENDSIDEKDRNHIAWTSYITTHRDGLASLLLPARGLGLNDGFTLSLPNITEEGWSKHYNFEDVRSGTREEIEINGIEYVVIVGQKTITRQLVQAKRSRKLYFIDNDIAHEVTSNYILNENGLDEDDAVLIDDEEIETFAIGEELTYPNGTVIEEDGKKYVIADGVKRRLANAQSEEAFVAIRAIFTNIRDRLTNKIPEGAPVISDEGIAGETLVKVPGNKAVWKINGNKKKFFHRALVFEKHRFGWDKVKTITQNELDEFDFAGVVTYPDGTLVKTRDIARVFLIDNGKLRWIESEDDFHGLGLHFGNVIDIQFEELALYGEGDPVIAE